MSWHEEMCPHCRAKTGLDQPADTGAPAEPIEPPEVPTPIRVHTAGLPPFDCTLHPDGTLTAVVGGEVRQNFLSFTEMRERNWAGSRIEFHPGPLDTEPETTAAVQDALL